MQRNLCFRAAGAGESPGACIVAVMNPADAPSESKPTLLIIDDDQELCAMLAEYLAPEGFLTLTAGTGPAGIGQRWRAAGELVVLVAVLPGPSGVSAHCRNPVLRRVPVILLSAPSEGGRPVA